MILRKFLLDEDGGAAVEFALIIPAFLAAVMGVFLTGIYMQNYNAVRSVASDVQREIAVSYQRGNELNESQIAAITRGIAVNPPYLLKTNRLTVTAPDATSSRVTGAKEINFRVTYRMETILPFIDLDAFELTYSRPIFVVPGSSSSSSGSGT